MEGGGDSCSGTSGVCRGSAASRSSTVSAANSECDDYIDGSCGNSVKGVSVGRLIGEGKQVRLAGDCNSGNNTLSADTLVEMSLTREGSEDEWNRPLAEPDFMPRSERGGADESPGKGLLGGGSSDPVTQGLLRIFQNLATSMRAMGNYDTLMDKGRMVSSIPGYKDGSEIAKYIRGLEANLTDIGVERSQFKRILLSKLTPKAREQVVELVDSGEYT